MESVLAGQGKWGAMVTAVFFFLQVVIYAVITGYSESYVITAYSESGAFGLAGAVARAIISQTAIVLFGVAALKIYQRVGGGVSGVLATMPVNLAIFAFALPAMWFMRESALHFYQPGMLSGVQDSPLTLFGAVLSGRAIDPNIIALLPLYQVGLNVLAPYILAEPKPETAEERAQRQQREREEEQHRQEMKKLKLVGRAERGRAAFDAVKKKPELVAPVAAEAVGEETPATEESSPQQPPTTPQAPSTRAKHWTYRQLMEYALAVYAHEMDAEEARRAMQFISKGQRASRLKGAPYVASPQACRGWMKVQPWAVSVKAVDGEEQQEEVARA
jgi:hypothetical protein